MIFFFGGGGGVLISFAQCNNQNFADMSHLLDNPSVKYFFLFSFYFGGWSVEGSVRVVRGPVHG